ARKGGAEVLEALEAWETAITNGIFLLGCALLVAALSYAWGRRDAGRHHAQLARAEEALRLRELACLEKHCPICGNGTIVSDNSHQPRYNENEEWIATRISGVSD